MQTAECNKSRECFATQSSIFRSKMQIKFQQYKANSFNRSAIPTRHCFNACSSSSLYCSGLVCFIFSMVLLHQPRLLLEFKMTFRAIFHGSFPFFVAFFTEIHGNPFSFFDPILTIGWTNLSFLIISPGAFQSFVLFTRKNTFHANQIHFVSSSALSVKIIDRLSDLLLWVEMICGNKKSF